MSRDAGRVDPTLVTAPEQLADLGATLAAADRVAIDTETPISGPRAGLMRVMSIALRLPDGTERAYVIDARDLDPTLLGPVLDEVTADAWNADFDARVIDRAVWSSEDVTDHITWWDGLLADALIHQGRSGFTWYHGLAWATEHYLGLTAEGKGTIQLSYDATSDLTADQVAYAAADALHTLWVGDVLRRELTAAGLDDVCGIEQGARPFLDRMQRFGLPFDWDGWSAELDGIEARRREVSTELALLTGGGQGSLFDTSVEPSWNPGSDPQVRTALNTWAADRVRAWTAQRFGTPRDLNGFDSVTARVLREIGGELCDALLEYRNLTKVVTTYGESIHDHLDPDGRIRPQYLQVVGTNTGRLASRNPNAQNFTPRMKPHVRPADPDRVFVHADLSQAELRFLAQVAKDEPLRAAFARGDDVHVSTAASMFGFDPDELKAADPDRFKHLRQIAKALNFGIAYGQGAGALARSLSAEGTETTVDEAAELLARYRSTYPGTTAWAAERVAEIDALAAAVPDEIDWPLTLRLARGFPAVAAIRREFRAANDRYPDAAEIAALHPDRPTGPSAASPRLVAEVEWLLRYPAPVALGADGEPWTFASRTVAGRRQQFNLHLDRLFLVATMEAVCSTDPALVALRRRFATDHGLRLDPATMTETELERQFDERALRRVYMETVAADLGDGLAHRRLGRAAAARVSAMVNAWRNAPIQGGVADIMLAAYADLHRRLRRFDGAVPVQTVHDSVVVECAADDASAVAGEVSEALAAASLRFCPDVVPRADVDVRTSLAESSVITPAN